MCVCMDRMPPLSSRPHCSFASFPFTCRQRPGRGLLFLRARRPPKREAATAGGYKHDRTEQQKAHQGLASGGASVCASPGGGGRAGSTLLNPHLNPHRPPCLPGSRGQVSRKRASLRGKQQSICSRMVQLLSTAVQLLGAYMAMDREMLRFVEQEVLQHQADLDQVRVREGMEGRRGGGERRCSGGQPTHAILVPALPPHAPHLPPSPEPSHLQQPPSPCLSQKNLAYDEAWVELMEAKLRAIEAQVEWQTYSPSHVQALQRVHRLVQQQLANTHERLEQVSVKLASYQALGPAFAAVCQEYALARRQVAEVQRMLADFDAVVSELEEQHDRMTD